MNYKGCLEVHKLPFMYIFFSLFRHIHPLELTSHHFCIFCISLPATKRLKKIKIKFRTLIISHLTPQKSTEY